MFTAYSKELISGSDGKGKWCRIFREHGFPFRLVDEETAADGVVRTDPYRFILGAVGGEPHSIRMQRQTRALVKRNVCRDVKRNGAAPEQGKPAGFGDGLQSSLDALAKSQPRIPEVLKEFCDQRIQSAEEKEGRESSE